VGFPLGGSVGSGFVRFRAGRPELPVAVLAKVWPHSGEFGYLGPHSGECGYLGLFDYLVFGGSVGFPLQLEKGFNALGFEVGAKRNLPLHG
jgi:hypothetical protein